MEDSIRLAIVIALVLGLLGSGIALAQDAPEPPPPPDLTDPVLCEGDAHLHKVGEFARLARKAWSLSRWGDPSPVKRSEAKAMRHMRHCAEGDIARKKMRSIAEHERKQFKQHRAYRQVAPYSGFAGEGYWLKWLPIPRYIVACETSGYSGDGRWLARNASGAQGPAQLLGWPAPYPAMTDAERLRYWQVTRMVWNTSGAGAWACS